MASINQIRERHARLGPVFVEPLSSGWWWGSTVGSWYIWT